MKTKKIINVLKKYKKFLITTHINPDPDALASELALAFCLKRMGKKVSVINNDPVPERYKFLPGVQIAKQVQKGRLPEYDVVIVVDCGDLNRLAGVKPLIDRNKIIINIDHHITNDNFGDFNHVVKNASSTCEILFDLFKDAKFKLTKDIATNLYMGIMTDTGSFRYDNTTAHTHAIISELMTFDFSIIDLYHRLYESFSLRSLRRLQKVMSKFDSLYKQKVICVELQKRRISKIEEDVDIRYEIFKFFRKLKNAEVILIFSENKPSLTQVNLRSQMCVNVAKLAQHFGGGGHKRASGCMIKGSMKEAKRKMLAQVRKIL